jgi:hypothetical protein
MCCIFEPFSHRNSVEYNTAYLSIPTITSLRLFQLTVSYWVHSNSYSVALFNLHR